MTRVLVANRGEIAVRIIRACREAHVETVAVYSDADARALHTRLADQAVRIGPPPPSKSYLDIDAVIQACKATDADAVHPGYGFLAERAAFARACDAAGLTFIGPPAGVIERMGSKIAARDAMQKAGVPIVPGAAPADQQESGLAAAARAIGYPVLLKASAGGGGKGMRVVRSAAELREAIGFARREAESAFGDGTLYIERLIENPRHVEIQILADHHGNVVHLFERECSLQRRHQKVIEESPSPALTGAVRRRMCAAAVTAAEAVGYRNAGTIEFLVEGDGDRARFYFLEMNTRLQVEHAVTEAVTGVDLVSAQLAVARGERLPWSQAALAQRGHAVECRIYAEDPEAAFLPQAGVLALYREPGGPGIRVDSGVVQGDPIHVNYDPLIAKLIAYGESRDAAFARASAALRGFPILGIRTNLSFLGALLADGRVRAGAIDTGFIDRHLTELTAPAGPPPEAVAAAAHAAGGPATAVPGTPDGPAHDPWASLAQWGRG